MATNRAAGRWRPAAAAFAALALVALGAHPVRADNASVAIRERAFVPGTVSVDQTAGEPATPAAHAHVIWTNEDPGTAHTVTFDDPRLVSSGPLATGQVHEVVLASVGSFTYRCTIHPDMTGAVVVNPPSQVPAEAGEGQPADAGGGSGGSTAVVIGLAAVVTVAVAGLAWFLLRRRRPATSGAAPR